MLAEAAVPGTGATAAAGLLALELLRADYSRSLTTEARSALYEAESEAVARCERAKNAAQLLGRQENTKKVLANVIRTDTIADVATTRTVNGLRFEVSDLRGERGFPADARGLVYWLRRTVPARSPFTGRTFDRRETFVVRHSPDGWRCDEHDFCGLWLAAVPGAFASRDEAVAALKVRLGEGQK